MLRRNRSRENIALNRPVRVVVDYLGRRVTVTLLPLSEQEERGALSRLLDGQLEGAGLATKPRIFAARAAYADEVMTDVDGLHPKPDTASPGWQSLVPYPVRVAVGAAMERFDEPEVSILGSAEKNC